MALSSSVRTKRWTRVEYERLVDLGAFRLGERLELVGADWTIRAQGPIALDDDSEPEPDIAVVPGSRRDHRYAHPSHPVLIVEVADSSLDFDRGEKASLYARAWIADYWILNLRERLLEVYREPTPAPQARYGHRYSATITLGPNDRVSPLAVPSAAISRRRLVAMSEMASSAVRMKRWTRLEYEHLIDLGVVRPEGRLELLGGQLVVRELRGARRPPASAWSRLLCARHLAPGGRSKPNCRSPWTRSRSPSPTSPSCPVRRVTTWRLIRPLRLLSSRSRSPVSRSTAGRTPASTPGPAWPTTGSSTWWTNVLEVFRAPVADPHLVHGWRYASTATLRRGDTLTPVALRDSVIPVSDLLL